MKSTYISPLRYLPTLRLISFENTSKGQSWCHVSTKNKAVLDHKSRDQRRIRERSVIMDFKSSDGFHFLIINCPITFVLCWHRAWEIPISCWAGVCFLTPGLCQTPVFLCAFSLGFSISSWLPAWKGQRVCGKGWENWMRFQLVFSEVQAKTWLWGMWVWRKQGSLRDSWVDIGQDLGQWEEGRSAEVLGKPMSPGSLLLTKELLS